MSDKTMPIAGGCLCGKVRYKAEAPAWVGHCHCQQCRKHTGAAFATMLWYADGGVTWLGEKPAVYEFVTGDGAWLLPDLRQHAQLCPARA